MAASDSGNRWNAEREAVFLEVLEQTGNVTRATASAGLARSLVYRRRNMRPDFREKWQNAMEQALDYLEAYLWDKAMGKDVTGRPDGAVIDEKIAIFLLKAHRPEIFGDGKKRTHSDGQARGLSPRKRLMKKLGQMANKTLGGI
ncbi:hypothetical protein MNBD_ALPHA02-1339 [hydrothermal vent metagenome]|uniref:Uncharacterized protein n=1 Tax=hydrothermal vent metagenome TaxID=652676 RepID=A0A3B0S5D8_9ZZZZ